MSKWPKTMPWLTAKDFQHGNWAYNESDDSAEERQAENVECGTRFCLVGWVRHAFGLQASPFIGGDLPEEGNRFLIKLCENMERPIYDKLAYGEVWALASDAFEGRFLQHVYVFEDADPISESAAATAWRKTLKDFGYTEDA